MCIRIRAWKEEAKREKIEEEMRMADEGKYGTQNIVCVVLLRMEDVLKNLYTMYSYFLVGLHEGRIGEGAKVGGGGRSRYRPELVSRLLPYFPRPTGSSYLICCILSFVMENMLYKNGH